MKPDQLPWYVHFLVFIGSIIGLALLLGALFVSELLQNTTVTGSLGFILLFVTTTGRFIAERNSQSIFNMALFAIFTTGQVLFFLWMAESFPNDDLMPAIVALFQIVFFFLYRDSLQRFVAVCLFLLFSEVYIRQTFSDELASVFVNYLAFSFVMACLLLSVRYLNEKIRQSYLTAAFWAGFVYLLLRHSLFWLSISSPLLERLSLFLLVLVWIAILFKMYVMKSGLSKRALGVSVVALVIMSVLVWVAPAISIALVFITSTVFTNKAGFPEKPLVLLVISALATIVYVLQYYYNLDMTLLQKSALLALSGGTLLVFAGISYFILREEFAEFTAGGNAS